MLSLIPLLPFTGFLVNAFLGRRLSKGVSGGVACLAMLGAFGVSCASALRLLALEPGPGRGHRRARSTPGSPPATSTPTLAFRLDPLSMLMILVVTGIGSLIHIYSTAYMHEETSGEYARYFSYLNLFASFMLVLVLGDNLLVMFVGWEGVGLCSYLLIGFWFKKQSANDAGKKAFVVNRIGDFAFIIGMSLAFVTFGTVDFREIALEAAPMAAGDATLRHAVAHHAAVLRRRDRQVGADPALRLAAGRDGGPDAGVRPDPRRDDGDGRRLHDRPQRRALPHAPQTLEIVAVIGAATALMAGTIGLVQNDIKRVLAYSTVSQLGYMFLAMGVGAVRRRHLPPLHARVLQGADVPRVGRASSTRCTASRTCAGWAASARSCRSPTGRS